MTNWWMYPTNYSNGTEVNGVASFFVKYPNYILNGNFGIAIVLMIWIMSFVLSMALGTRKALMTASFIALMFSLWFYLMGSLPIIIVFTLVGLLIVGMLGSKGEGGL